jgi:arsenate reductase-like glutaredoxin family protein
MLAAASGLLPLPQNDLLEVLVFLSQSNDTEIASAARETLAEQNNDELLVLAKIETTSSRVLGYLTSRANNTRELYEAVIQNRSTPDEALSQLARSTSDASLVELIALNQERLVRYPQLIESILANPARNSEAERRARETKKEFFEKERGARQIAEELRARGKVAAAEFFETADLATEDGGELSVEDAWLIAEHIEVTDDDIDDSWLPAERYEELLGESSEDRAATVQRIIESERIETGGISTERVSMIRRLMLMNTRDRMKLAMKGDREARTILVRDSNRVVSTGVINNPRITEQEVENIAAMRTISDDVLRLIAMNRAWARAYPIIHNLARNPKTPIPTVMNILPRIRTKDLKNLSQNRNVSEAVRRQAVRIGGARSGE